MIAWKTQAQALISSKTLRNEGSGAMHMVRYVSRKGSQYTFRRLILQAFFPFLSNFWSGLTVDVLTLSIADTASRT
jgi:hypothetical protein